MEHSAADHADDLKIQSAQQHKLKAETVALSAFIEANEEKTENIAHFISIVRKTKCRLRN